MVSLEPNEPILDAFTIQHRSLAYQMVTEVMHPGDLIGGEEMYMGAGIEMVAHVLALALAKQEQWAQGSLDGTLWIYCYLIGKFVVQDSCIFINVECSI